MSSPLPNTGTHAPNQGGRVIVVGNEKGGCGKSTTAMHLIVGLLQDGHKVASIDLDLRQSSLSRYIANRRAYASAIGKHVELPEHYTGTAVCGDDATNESNASGEQRAIERLSFLIDGARVNHDVVVIDTPGSDSPLSRIAHAKANTLVTPVNDSFVDLDVLGHIDAQRKEVLGPSQYADMVLEQISQRHADHEAPTDWIVVRNRIGALDTHNARDIEWALSELSAKIGFRTVPGFSERVIFRELFLIGLTILDLKDAAGGKPLNASHLAAREEVLALVNAVNTGPAIATDTQQSAFA